MTHRARVMHRLRRSGSVRWDAYCLDCRWTWPALTRDDAERLAANHSVAAAYLDSVAGESGE